MKTALFAAAVLLVETSAFAQKPFAPLEAWENAVSHGDAAALATFYAPGAVIQAGTKNAGIAEECAFWTAFEDLTKFIPRLMEISEPGPSGHVKITVRLSFGTRDRNLYGIERQEWAPTGDGWKIVASRRAAQLAIEDRRTLPQPAAPNVKLYPEPTEAEADLREGLARAAREHKRVIAVFGANWCYDCHVLDTTFRSKEFAPLVDANFVVVHISVGEESKDNLNMAARLGVAVDKGVPSLAVLEADGSVVYAQKNGEFEDTVKYGPADVRGFLEKWKPYLPGSPKQ